MKDNWATLFTTLVCFFIRVKLVHLDIIIGGLDVKVQQAIVTLLHGLSSVLNALAL
jgi:ABC-type phosphonate transport system ATPase subunit